MRFLLKQDKKAISNMVAYAILISITISLSIIVYGWLRFYAGAEGLTECPDDVNLVIEGYTCTLGISGNQSTLTVNLKNKGLFTIDGYTLRVHDRPDAEFGIYTLADTEKTISPGEKEVVTSTFNDPNDPTDPDITEISLIEVQPFLMEGEKVVCRSVVVQKDIICS